MRPTTVWTAKRAALLRRLDVREGDLDQGALLAAALDRKLGLVRFDQRLGQWQAQAGPALRRALADLAERREREAHFILVHADAGVAHADHRLARGVDGGRDDHLPARLIELHRVRHQVQHDLLERAFVDHNAGQAVVERDAHNDPFARSLRLHQRHAFTDDAFVYNLGEI